MAQASETKNIVRVGVAEPYNQSAEVFQPSWERDLLVRYINREAKRKKSEAAIEAVPLHGSSLEEVANEARQQSCAYVLLTTATGTNAGVAVDSRDGSSRVPGAIGTGGRSADLLINYQIQGLTDARTAAQGSVTACGSDYQGQPTRDWNDAVRQAMDELAPLVVKEIRKHPAPKPD